MQTSPALHERAVDAGAPGVTVVDTLRALAEPTRLRIVRILASGERTVSELVWILGQSQPRVSRHLRVLDDAGVVTRVNEGAWVFCRLRPGRLVQAILTLPATDPNDAADQMRLDDLRRDRSGRAERYFHEHAHEWNTLRSLYVSESRVEQAVREVVGDAAVEVLVDVGTGTGRMLELLAAQASSAIGIDQSAAMLSAARPTFDDARYGHVQLRQGDMYRLSLPAGYADLVTMHQVLHFADDPARVLMEIGRVLRPDGRALVVDFAPHDVEFLREHHAHRRLGFSTADIVVWAAQAGLMVREAGRLPGVPLTVVLWELRRSASETRSS